MTFTQKVYEYIQQIPRGKVMTYGQVAAVVGSPKASRAVGLAMKTNPHAPATPCHRVVASDGSLTGYSGGNGISSKKQMLMEEGVTFKGEKVDLTVSLWRPTIGV